MVNSIFRRMGNSRNTRRRSAAAILNRSSKTFTPKPSGAPATIKSTALSQSHPCRLTQWNCARVTARITTNAAFIRRRRRRSCSASLGSCMRVAPRMPPGAVSEGRCIIANDNTAGYNLRNAMVTMVEQFQSFSKLRHCVWLDTASGGGRSLLAAEPVKVFRTKGERGVFERLRAELESWPGYAVGYFGYDRKNEIERLPARAVDDLRLPDCWFGFYKDVRVSDRAATTQPSVTTPILQHTNPSLRSNFARDSYR